MRDGNGGLALGVEAVAHAGVGLDEEVGADQATGLGPVAPARRGRRTRGPGCGRRGRRPPGATPPPFPAASCAGRRRRRRPGRPARPVRRATPRSSLDRALAPVQAEGGPPVVALRRLDAGHVGPEHPEQHPGERALDPAGGLDHPDAGEGQVAAGAGAGAVRSPPPPCDWTMGWAAPTHGSAQHVGVGPQGGEAHLAFRGVALQLGQREAPGGLVQGRRKRAGGPLVAPPEAASTPVRGRRRSRRRDGPRTPSTARRRASRSRTTRPRRCGTAVPAPAAAARRRRRPDRWPPRSSARAGAARPGGPTSARPGPDGPDGRRWRRPRCPGRPGGRRPPRPPRGPAGGVGRRRARGPP